MRAFQPVGWGQPPELREVPVPEPGTGQVLVKIGGAGACHSDLHTMEAPGPPPGLATELPFTLGHENAGWVESLGPGVTGFTPGDPVIVYGSWGCGICANCRQGGEHYCSRMLVEHFPLERADEAYELLHDGRIQGRAVITPHASVPTPPRPEGT